MPGRVQRQRRSTAGLTLALAALLATVPGAAAAGKPGYPDKVTWAAEVWSIKTSRAAVGPGPNVFAKDNVSVDGEGRLHLQISRNPSGKWTSAEIIGPRTYGYGTYTFTVASSVHDLDPNVVLGLFTWSDKAPYAHREIDIEFARWGDDANQTNAQYVVQPASSPGHLQRFVQPPDSTTTHRFTWRPGRIDWASFDSAGAPIAAYTYAATDVPRTGDERVRLNLWLFDGRPPTDGQPVEVILDSFAFTP